MKNLSKENERLVRLNKAFLYNVGYEHAQNVCKEMDQLNKKYEDIDVPDTLNEWFDHYQKEVKRNRNKVQMKKQISIIKGKIAILFTLLCVTGSIITMSVEAFRIIFFNMVVETSQKFSLVTHEVGSEMSILEVLPDEWTDYYYPAFLPEGYKLLSYRALNNTKYMVFSNDQNSEIKLIQGNLSSESQIDSELVKSVEVEINENRGLFIEKDDLGTLSWNNNEKSFYLQGNIEKSMLLKIAEKLEKK
ncbi:DUF4367 domain-containing protein [Fusibacter sp. 3D3]|uniref:DUF4367 domain-containing protein n=1 Tax=Fusibacter sp. 3D3 TaxID=1048380 RepID=UPI000852FB7F|nr:DUF4367 domain-containing protein [Fusibacter sp. 3D3]GAU76647.1 outer membrane lipoprotein-sorting protein [Fusibacter sp. 3D3]